jgi:M6 family metalloprotease-like protein
VSYRVLSIIVLLIASVLPARYCGAMPAAPTVHRLMQQDGSGVAARQWGDEYLSGWETGDGYTIVFDADLGSWTYAVHDRVGNLISSGRRPDREQPIEHSAKRIRPQRENFPKRFSAAGLIRPQSSTVSADSTPQWTALPPDQTTAAVTRNLPVILVNFSDTIPAYTPADFTELLFGSGNWSFKDYYEEVSGGRFSVSPGSPGVSGWVTVANSHDYYGKKSAMGHIDAWPGDLVYEAVQKADPALDFSVYDNDGDCSVDTVAIVHQGTAQEGSGTMTDLWSHSMSLSITNSFSLSHYGPYTTNDRCVSDPSRFVMVDRYIMMPERYGSDIAAIGVFAHEFGHALGLIDLYDSDNTSEGAGDWSLMASGSWGGVNRLGDRPSHPDPWSKSALGWVTPFRIMSDVGGSVMEAVESGGDVFQFLGRLSEGGTGEYFLLENRQQAGFDAALPGSGLLLWHIDETRTGNNYEWYPGCTTCSSHYKVALIQADNRYDLEKKQNRGDAGDPFPGAANNRSISPVSAPPGTLYGGVPAGFVISSISDSASVMTVDVHFPDLTPPVSTITGFPAKLSGKSSGSFSFSANESADFACRMDAGDFFPCTTPFVFAGLADGSHNFSVRATDLAGNEETTPASYDWTVDTTAPPCNIRNGTACFETFSEAYAAILPGSRTVIKLRQLVFGEEFNMNRQVDVRLEGGYDSSFTGRSGSTVFVGKVTVSAGSVAMDEISLRVAGRSLP